MKRAAAGMAVLLGYLILTIWIDARWAWALAQCAVFLWMGAWCAGQLRYPGPVRGSLWLLPLCAAPVWGLLQLAAGRTVYRWGTWNAVLDWTTWLALFFLALQIFEPQARRWFLRFTVYFGGGLSVLATVQMYTSGGRFFWIFPSGYTDYVLGPFVYRNHYAAFLEMILPVALWEALRDRRRSLLYGALAAAMLASVIAAASRAGALLMCLEVAAVLLAAQAKKMAPAKELGRFLVAFVLMALLFSSLMGWQALRLRLRQPDPYAGRREFVRSSLEMLRDRPGMGFGLGNWARVYPRYALFDDGAFVNQAHNDWLQWAAEGGVPFFVIMLSLAAMATPAAWRSVWGIGLLAIWVHCLVEYPMQQRPAIGAWFFVMLGVLAAARPTRIEKRPAGECPAASAGLHPDP